MNKDTPSTVITYDDFVKIDLRTGIVIAAENVKKSMKLLKLQVYLGALLGVRTIVAGISPSYNTTNILNKRVLVVTNLAPRKIMGIESHGMLLAGANVGSSAEQVFLAECPDVDPGTLIG